MKRLRLLTLGLIVWLIVLFNMSRPDIFIGDIDLRLQLSPVVYGMAAVAVGLILLLPDLGQVRLWKLLVPFLLAYLCARFVFTPFNPLRPKITTYFIVTEMFALIGTVVSARLLSLVISNIERAVEAVLVVENESRVLPKSDGFEAINMELERARRFSRTVGFIFVNIDLLPEMHETQHDASKLEFAFRRRYIQQQVDNIVESCVSRSDIITWYNDGLLICIPEIAYVDLGNTAKHLANLIKGYLAKSLVMGIATFPEDGLILDDIIATMLRRQIAYADYENEFIDEEGAIDLPEIPTTTGPKEGLRDAVSEEQLPRRTYQSIRISQPTLPLPHGDGTLTLTLNPGLRILATLFASNLTEILPNPERLITVNSPKVAQPDNPGFWVNQMPYQSQTSRAAYRIIKRIFDLFAVLLSAPLTLPLFGLVTLAVYLDSGGPIIFVQERTGVGGHRFKMYKFRTMAKNAEEMLKSLAAQGLAQLDERGKLAAPLKLKTDPRVTRIGRILRKTSLDELPQLWNVLRGDMSLVGPRPTSWTVSSYTLPQTQRLGAQPGITGLWQVYGRGSTDFAGWVRWDALYIDKMSFSLDLKLLFLTVKQVLARKGAR